MAKHSLRSVSNHRSKVVSDYNVIIVGGGPAGIAAGIYAKYDGNNPLIIEQKTLAWIPELHVNLLGRLEGFPALLNTVNGSELIARFRHSLSEMNVDYIEHTTVSGIQKHGDEFQVAAGNVVYQTAAVIIATGTVPIPLSSAIINGHEKDVHYFGYNNFAQYVDQEVVVLGSRNSGSTAAIYLAKQGLNVTIIELKSSVQAKYKHTQHFEPLGIKTITSAQVTKLNGKDRLESLTFIKDGTEQSVPCHGLYCYIGVQPLTGLAESLGILMSSQHYLETDFYQSSNIPGVFLAGDVCGDLKHIIAACGQGAKAAYNVNKYLMTNREGSHGSSTR